MWYYVFMTNNFEVYGSSKTPEPNELSEKDLAILSGDLKELKQDIEFHNLLKFTNLVLNSFDTEEEEIEEDEED